MRNPANHCVPILDVLEDPIDPTQSLLVMPYLRPFNDPDFGAIGEVVDFVEQTLEVITVTWTSDLQADQEVVGTTVYS